MCSDLYYLLDQFVFNWIRFVYSLCKVNNFYKSIYGGEVCDKNRFVCYVFLS
jgi:hypothetical protein